MNVRNTFQVISYLQYPLMLVSLFFAVKPYFSGFDAIANNIDDLLKDYNYVLIFLGLGISFSTLQDTTKTQNDVSKKVWEDPKKGKRAIWIISGSTLIVLIYGIFGYFISDNPKVKELAFGAIVFGIGLIGFLKTAIEMFENHRTDKNPKNINL